MIGRAYRRFTSFLGVFGGLLIVAIAFLTGWDVVARRAFRAPIVWAEEISEFLLVISVFLTLALTWSEERHIRVDVLYSRLSPKRRMLANLSFSLWALLFCGALTWYGVLDTIDVALMGEKAATITFLPTFWVKAFIPIGAFLLCVQICHSAYCNILHKNRQVADSRIDERDSAAKEGK